MFKGFIKLKSCLIFGLLFNSEFNSHPVFASIQDPKTKIADEIGWEKIDETDGIKVYRREVPGNDLLQFKGDAIVDANLAKVASVIFDATRAPEWIPDLVSSRIVRWTSDNEFVEYDHIGTPFVIKDRDFVSLVRFDAQPAEKRITFVYKSYTDPAIPETRFVRGDLMNTTFVLTSIQNDTKTHIIGEIHADPKGNVPKWVANLFQKDWPINTFKGLRTQLKKPDVKENPRFKDLLQGSGLKKLVSGN